MIIIITLALLSIFGSRSRGDNEAGLVTNLLWQVDADYPQDDGQTPRLSLSLWAQYFLD